MQILYKFFFKNLKIFLNYFKLKLPPEPKSWLRHGCAIFSKPFLYTDTRTLLTQGARHLTRPLTARASHTPHTARASQAAYTHAAYGNPAWRIPHSFVTISHTLRRLHYRRIEFCIAARTGTSLYYLYNLCL